MPAHSNDWGSPLAWISELDRSRRVAEPHWTEWQANVDYYIGKTPNKINASAILNDADSETYINVNADFYNVELKLAQLFYDQPNLQLSAKGEFKPRRPASQIPGQPPQPQPDSGPIIAAHRALLTELLGPSHANVLTTIQKAIKDCLLSAGAGATKIGYNPTLQAVPMGPPASPPEPLGAPQSDVPEMGGPFPIPGMQAPQEAPQQPVQVQPLQQRPVYEQWYWDRIASKKFRIPADFSDSDYDKAPWIGMEFRLPLSVAQAQFDLPENFTGTIDRDKKLLAAEGNASAVSELPYVDGTEIWYLAHIFDPDAIHPLLIRRHVLVEGYNQFVERTTASPFQTQLPDGRLSADSMIGYPIHVLTVRDVPDSAFIPSDSSMTRPLVHELCTFRTQQVQERQANIPRILYDSTKLAPQTVTKIVEGTIGSLIPVQEDALMNGMQSVMAQVVQGTSSRTSYSANDYIQRDLEKTLGIDATGTGIKAPGDASATEIAVIDKQRNVRLDAERRRVLAWYLKGVEKFSTLVIRFMTPQLAIPYIGQDAAMAWAGWDKQTWDGRFVFGAKPDSQIRLDAAAERKYALDLYQFTAKDPNVNRVLLLHNLLEKAGLDPSEIIIKDLPEQKIPPQITFTFKGDDLVGPQAAQVREVLAASGINITPEAVQGVPPGGLSPEGVDALSPRGLGPEQHGGPTPKVRPLSQQSADRSQNRGGRPTMDRAQTFTED